jgi:hypothetical protein
VRGTAAPAEAFLAADAGAFAALGGEYIGVAGVGVAPAQIGVELARVNWRNGPKCASIGLAQEA